MDSPLSNWNRQGLALLQLPRPSPQGDSANTAKCRANQVRQPASAAEKALVRRGWLMYGPVYSYDSTRIVTALSGFDGMCRPLGYQAFVYWDGRYAGTLSPVPMNSRTDGALTSIHLNGPGRFSADFARYRESDALCCPSRVDSVAYAFRRDDIPTLAATHVTPTAACLTDGPDAGTPGLFGKRWILSEMEGRRFNAEAPHMEFDRNQNRVAGSSGCNRFIGAFQTDGSRLTFSPMAGTKRACIDNDMQRAETAFLKSLSSTTRYEVSGNTLHLFSNEVQVLSFESR
ncbi:META domain-containing protein [Massilia cavernae]|uniref:META domain-containing protein n=1 Tax=Massilia cavernae TaxID=2320864 RepID=A0A418Y176_9BURK|nr:META domain-containing protein [Massilia cavernae]